MKKCAQCGYPSWRDEGDPQGLKLWRTLDEMDFCSPICKEKWRRNQKEKKCKLTQKS